MIKQNLSKSLKKQLANNKEDAKPFDRLRIAKWIEDTDWAEFEEYLIRREEIDKFYSLVAIFMEACEKHVGVIARAEAALSIIVEEYAYKRQQPQF